MKINWKVRINNKLFWLAFIPAMLMLVKAVANAIGYDIDLMNIESDLIAVVEAVFLVLGVMGIVADPTTKGLGDSENALTYEKPKE